eukprot:885930-Pyramimonas_sp.AAC.1
MGLLLTALDRCCVFAHEYAWQGRKRIEKLGGLLSEVLCIILERDSHDLIRAAARDKISSRRVTVLVCRTREPTTCCEYNVKRQSEEWVNRNTTKDADTI